MLSARDIVSMQAAETVKRAASRRSPTKADVLAKTASAATDIAATSGVTYTDDQIALVTLHVATGKSVASVCRSLGAPPRWGYAQFRRADVQALAAQTALTVLGLEAGRSIRSLALLRDSSKDERMRYNAAIELMDRAGLGNTTATRSTGGVHAFTFSNPSVKSDG
jgi:hypothetical protein